jgi:hypothetical protein
MNPIDSSVESIEAGGLQKRQRPLRLRPAIVQPFEAWLKAQNATFAITFDRFCSDAYQATAVVSSVI